MKIIDNKKDYYDYLSGIYGVDDLVVYDRRGSVHLNSNSILWSRGVNYYFSHDVLPLDKPMSPKSYWNLKSISKQRVAETAKHKYGKTWKEGDE